jgi:hypothetical protein
MHAEELSEYAPEAEPHKTEPVFQRYRVGIHLSIRGLQFSSSGSHHGTETSNKLIEVKHWKIVFSPFNELYNVYTIEAFPNREGRVAFHQEIYRTAVSSYVFAEYKGDPEEAIEEVLKAHPMRGTQYTPCFNNCQHFAAAFVRLLQVYADEGRPYRDFKTVDEKQLDAILSVLKPYNFRLYNDPNIFFPFVHGTASAGAVTRLAVKGGTRMVTKYGASYGAASMAGTKASAAAATAASGLIGTKASVAAATAVSACLSTAVLVPAIITAGTFGAGAGYIWQRHSWTRDSMFEDPIYHGFPRDKDPLDPTEWMVQEDFEAGWGQILRAKFLGSVSRDGEPEEKTLYISD